MHQFDNVNLHRAVRIHTKGSIKESMCFVRGQLKEQPFIWHYVLLLATNILYKSSFIPGVKNLNGI